MRLDRKSGRLLRRALGPWYVKEAAGCGATRVSWRDFHLLIRQGRVKPTSVVLGPATGGLWRFARDTPSVATELGMCWSCHVSLPDRTATFCSGCGQALNGPVEASSHSAESPPGGGDRIDDLAEVISARPGRPRPAAATSPEKKRRVVPTSLAVLVFVTVCIAITWGTYWLMFRHGKSGLPPGDLAERSPQPHGPTAPGIATQPAVTARTLTSIQNMLNLAGQAERGGDLPVAQIIIVRMFKAHNYRAWPAEALTKLETLHARFRASPPARSEPSPEKIAAQREAALAALKQAEAHESKGELESARKLLVDTLNACHPRAWPAGCVNRLCRIHAKLRGADVQPGARTPSFFGVEAD